MTSPAVAADGALSLDLWISSGGVEEIVMDESCEPLEYLPWYGDEIGPLTCAAGDTDTAVTRVGDDVDRVDAPMGSSSSRCFRIATDGSRVRLATAGIHVDPGRP